MVRALFVGALLLAGWLHPALASACPSCARDSGNGPVQWLLLGSMILFPFAVAAVVIRFIRRVDEGAGVLHPTRRGAPHPTGCNSPTPSGTPLGARR